MTQRHNGLPLSEKDQRETLGHRSGRSMTYDMPGYEVVHKTEFAKRFDRYVEGIERNPGQPHNDLAKQCREAMPPGEDCE